LPDSIGRVTSEPHNIALASQFSEQFHSSTASVCPASSSSTRGAKILCQLPQVSAKKTTYARNLKVTSSREVHYLGEKATLEFNTEQ
jgi:hypothetical protein